MSDDERTEEELLDILAPRDDNEPVYDVDGYIQGCSDCGFNPDVCWCGLYAEEDDE